MKGGGGGAQIPTVVAEAFFNELHQNTLKIHKIPYQMKRKVVGGGGSLVGLLVHIWFDA